ncbi:MAG: UDP-N-acetylglucosamine--N-acetylmuramyl-(pentapeptide) pyrophosphoryl-undecaprenol N-acetylglucosamine transferase [bacterium]
MRLIITGGHHSSALPVIGKLRAQYPEVQIFWFGHKFSAQGDVNPTLEFREITALGIPFYHLRAGKFYRTGNLIRLAKIPLGFVQCFFLLLKVRPHAILSFGGYLAVPTVLAGWILGIPSITHEQTVVAGWANRLIAKVAKKVLLAWPESAKYFPPAKTVVVGLPLRPELFEVRSHHFDFEPALPVIYITTGKIGSHLINTVVKECLSDLLELYHVVHQCGDNSVFNDFAALQEAARALSPHPGKYYLRKFVLADEIGEVYQKCQLVVSRAGAHTTVELLTLRKQCVLIPIPWVSHNEQQENARLLVAAGLGTILSEAELTAASLSRVILQALKRSQDQVTANPPQTSRNAAGLIVQHLMAVIQGS